MSILDKLSSFPFITFGIYSNETFHYRLLWTKTNTYYLKYSFENLGKYVTICLPQKAAIY